jgi:hypothetical protein
MVTVALLLNFLLFLFSFWPYQGVTKEEPGRKPGVTAEAKPEVDREAFKSNLITYVSVNVGIMALGISATILNKRKKA